MTDSGHDFPARHTRPDQDEAEPYYFGYIDQAPDGDIVAALRQQAVDAAAFFTSIPDARSTYRYEDTKWSIREVLAHLNDTERLFAFRAFWFARTLDASLPSFDQDVAALASGADGRSWAGHIDEFRAVRAATIALFEHLPSEAWSRRGIASGRTFSVRALAWIAAGHVVHHERILRERYL